MSKDACSSRCRRPAFPVRLRSCLYRSAALLLAVGLSACGRSEFTRESYVFGTHVQISVVDANDKAEAVVDAALRELDRLHTELHAWQPGPISRLNRAFAAGESAPLTPEIEELIRLSQWAYRQSDGAFNPAIGGLVSAWGFHGDQFKAGPPPARDIETWAKTRPTPFDVHVEKGRARSVNPAVRLDFGGIAKGWALDRLASRLRQNGIDHALLNIGGNILALGRHGDRRWRVGLQHPRKPEAMLELELNDGEAIGTSGDYQRYFVFAGKRYSHLLDPASGWPAAKALSATVIAPPGRQAGLISDVASKPLFIGGSAQAQTAMRRFGVQDWLVMNPDGTVYLSKTMQTRVHWLGASPKAVAVEPRAG